MDAQERIEDAILHYQLKLKGNNKREQETAYNAIIKLYNPEDFLNDWAQKYLDFFDSPDDFRQEYNVIFLTALQEWKPRNVRPESKWNGSGKFQNYLISCLKNTFANFCGKQKTSKCNFPIRCPICDEVFVTLYKHLLKAHTHLLFEKLAELGIDTSISPTCQLCKSCRKDKDLEKHYINKHTNYLFERFEDLYPTISIHTDKPVSVYVDESAEEHEQNLYDTISSENHMDNLLALNLSPLQQQMITNILDPIKNISFKYDSRYYNCTENEFNAYLEDLRNKMILSGFEVGEDEIV